MSSKSETVKTRTVRVFDLDDYNKLLEGLRVAACMLTESHQVVDEASVLRRLSVLTRGGPSDGNCCSCCGVGPFETREQQTAHYKDHWHTHNLKRKLFGKSALSLGQFSSRQDDNSSVSGSDSEGEDSRQAPANDLFAAATRHCKAFFTNQAGNVFCVYRCILHHRKEVLSTDGDGSAWIQRCQRLRFPGALRWAVVMVSGGHFAGGVFSGAAEVVHKTLRSYVTRRGQGQAQAARDSRAGHAPRSAGATLRRRNQAQFVENVQEIVSSWSEHLKGCEFIFYRAVGSLNQSALFGKNTPIAKDDPRVRQLPFPTRKPSFKEVKRVHETLASLEVYESMELFQKALMLSSAKAPNKTSSNTSIESGKKTQKTGTNKPIDRAKSRERAPRELPTDTISSEDEGPCYIDSETPPDWIKTLSEQSSNGVITNSRKDLLNDCAISSPGSESEIENIPETKVVKKERKRQEDKQVVKKIAPAPQKIPADVKKMWMLILNKEESSLDPILEAWEGDVEVACNTQDPADGNTALHKAAIAAKPDMVSQLLSAGGDPCVRNHQLQTPYAASQHHDTRVAFRMFQASNPDKYNYAKSQIPGPVTPEQLEQEKERKAQQKRAKRQREKEKQLEKAKKDKFLLLSDAQKVEAREGRCFLCGNQLPKMAFEYEVYKFCAVGCMQNHRNVRPLYKSE